MEKPDFTSAEEAYVQPLAPELAEALAFYQRPTAFLAELIKEKGTSVEAVSEIIKQIDAMTQLLQDTSVSLDQVVGENTPYRDLLRYGTAAPEAEVPLFDLLKSVGVAAETVETWIETLRHEGARYHDEHRYQGVMANLNTVYYSGQ